jgi:hypothetical protein
MSEYIKNEELKYQFVLYINENIICQRYFNIYDFNEDSLNSIEIKDLMDAITGINNGKYSSQGIIPRHLKQKSIKYLWDTYNPYFLQNEELNRNINTTQTNLAQELREILPSFVNGTESENEYLGIDYNGILALTVKAIQELKAEIDILKAR